MCTLLSETLTSANHAGIQWLKLLILMITLWALHGRKDGAECIVHTKKAHTEKVV